MGDDIHKTHFHIPRVPWKEEADEVQTSPDDTPRTRIDLLEQCISEALMAIAEKEYGRATKILTDGLEDGGEDREE